MNSIDQYKYNSQLWPWPLTTYIINGVTSLWSSNATKVYNCSMWQPICITIWISLACYSPETIPFQIWQFGCEMRYLTETIEWRICVKNLDSVVYGKTHRKNETYINWNIIVDAILFRINSNESIYRLNSLNFVFISEWEMSKLSSACQTVKHTI